MTELIELKTIINDAENALFENAEYDPRLSLADNVRGVCLDLERAQKHTTSALAERDELEALQAENVVFRGRGAALEAEIAILRGLVAIGNKGLYERDTLQVKCNEAMSIVSKLYALVIAASFDDGPEAIRAKELIDAMGVSSTTESVSMDMLHVGATENKRLREVLSNLLVGTESYLAEEGRPVETLRNYGPSEAWFQCAIEAARREFQLPFTDATKSDHAPDGLSPLSAKDTTLLDDLDEIGVMLQDYARTDDHTARHAASSLLSTATSNYTERAESAATTPPNDTNEE